LIIDCPLNKAVVAKKGTYTPRKISFGGSVKKYNFVFPQVDFELEA